MKHVALVLKNFLEPTHIHICNCIFELVKNNEFKFSIFYKNYVPSTLASQIESMGLYIANYRLLDSDLLQNLQINLIFAIYDGETSIRAFQLAKANDLPFACGFQSGYDYGKRLDSSKTFQKIFLIFSQADLIICSGLLEENALIRKGIAANKIRVLWPILPNVALSPSTFAIDNDNWDIVLISRLVERKGVSHAINTLALLPEKYRLIIIGDGPLKDALMLQADQLGISKRVLFVGQLPLYQAVNRLAAARILLHTPVVTQEGYTESVPQSLFIGCALGKAIVCSNVGGVPDIIIHEYNGLLCNQASPEDFCSAILYFEDDLCYKKLAGNAQKTYAEKGTFSNQIRTLANELNKCKVVKFNYKSFFTTDNLINIESKLDKVCLEHSIIKSDISLIGVGGIGLIFLGGERTRKFVIKISNLLSREHKTEKALQKEVLIEARVLENVKSQVVPKLIWTDPKGEYFIREYVDGISLNNFVNPLRAVEERVRDVYKLYNTCKVLFNIAHNNSPKYLIRDLKPANLICNNRENFILCDVGSVRKLGYRQMRVQKNRLGKKSWVYWSPELLEDKNNVDERTDYFSFGATAYFLLLGENCYSNSEATTILAETRYKLEYANALTKLQPFKSKLHSAFFDCLVSCLNPTSIERKFW